MIADSLFRGVLHKNEELGLWGVPLPTDEPVVYRTQRYRHDVLGQRPLQFQQFLGVRKFFQGFGLLLGMAYFSFLCFFSWTRNLLLKVITVHIFTFTFYTSVLFLKSFFEDVEKYIFFFMLVCTETNTCSVYK